MFKSTAHVLAHLSGSSKPINRQLLMLCLWPLFFFLSNMWAPDFIDTEGGDHSMMFSAHYAFTNLDRLAGTGIHTTGRWSILYWNLFWPGTYLFYIVGHAVVTAVPFALLVRNVQRNDLTLWGSTALLILLALCLARSTDGRFLAVAAVAIWTAPSFQERRTDPLFLLALLILALAAHVKATFLLIAMVTAVGTAVLEITDRRAPFHALALVLFFFAWMAIGGIPWADVQLYVLHGLSSNEGYGALFFEPGEAVPTILAVAILAFATAVILGAYWRSGWQGFVRVVMWAVLLFVAFKTASVRPDGQHLWRLLMLIAVLAVVGLSTTNRFTQALASLTRPTRVRVVAVVVAVIAIGSAAASDRIRLAAGEFARVKTVAVAEQYDLLSRFLWGDGLVGRHEAAVARVRGRVPLPMIPGSVGAYGIGGTSIPLSYHLDVGFLPILAPYEVWSAGALRRNREHLAGPRSPDGLLVNGIYSADGVFQTILENYKAAFAQGRTIYFERRSSPLRLIRKSETDLNATWGQSFAIPSPGNGLVVVEYDFEYSLLGRLVAAAYRTVPVSLDTTADGRLVRSQLLAREVGRGGLIVSPVALDAEETAGMVSWGCLNPNRGRIADELRLVAGNPSDWLMKPSVARWLFKDYSRVIVYSVRPEGGATACSRD
jgi:hypothetical protein